MSVYLNPFHGRASEQQLDARQFVSTFGAGALYMLPANSWDRLVLLRSSPGTGKTSLMRLFTPESLEWVRIQVKQSEPIHQALLELGAIDDERTLKMGVLIDLDHEYKSLLDLPIEPEVARKLFLRLLDVRVLVGVLRSALTLVGRRFPDDVSEIQFGPACDGRIENVLERLGGPDGEGILNYARATEQAILRLLDALLASDVHGIPEGHNELYSLSLLTRVPLNVAGVPLDAQPLVMFDDGHRLDWSQRETLLEELRRRRPAVGRWYSERFEALSDQELLAGVGQEDRDVALVELDTIARDGSSDGRRFTRGRYERILADIARRRAAQQLYNYAQEDREFLQLLSDQRDEGFETIEKIALRTLEERVLHLAAADDRYSEWIAQARLGYGFEAAVRWRELEVLIQRDQNRQQDLFNSTLSAEQLSDRSSSAVREGCRLAVANEFKVPYYTGHSMVLRLGSFNAHQFLGVCGDLFAEMLIDVGLGRSPYLNIERQHRVLREGSERFWEAIPRTVPHGRDVQTLVHEIVEIARMENAKPRMPYPPGVTGTAILMAERNLLLDPEYRAKMPGADRLFAALASAIANNILSAELNYSVKGMRYMVLYLNRLLCPRFNLPLGYGGFKERRLQVVIELLRKQTTKRGNRSGESIREELPL